MARVAPPDPLAPGDPLPQVQWSFITKSSEDALPLGVHGHGREPEDFWLLCSCLCLSVLGF